jgi:hypothetical protein
MVTCKCEGCNNPNCGCQCEDALECTCKDCGCNKKLDLKVKGVNPSDRFHCEGCSG